MALRSHTLCWMIGVPVAAKPIRSISYTPWHRALCCIWHGRFGDSMRQLLETHQMGRKQISIEVKRAKTECLESSQEEVRRLWGYHRAHRLSKEVLERTPASDCWSKHMVRVLAIHCLHCSRSAPRIEMAGEAKRTVSGF